MDPGDAMRPKSGAAIQPKFDQQRDALSSDPDAASVPTGSAHSLPLSPCPAARSSGASVCRESAICKDDARSDDDDGQDCAPGRAGEQEEERFGVLRSGFQPEVPLEPGIRDGSDIVVRWLVTSAQHGQAVPDALMSLDPMRYPTTSRAKKAARRGLVLKYRVGQHPELNEQSLSPKDRLKVVKTSTVVQEGESLALQTQLGCGFYPHIPFDRPNFKLDVLYQVC
jgi:hypothetical protein